MIIGIVLKSCSHPWSLLTLYFSRQAHLSRWPLLCWFEWSKMPAPLGSPLKGEPTHANLCLALWLSRWEDVSVWSMLQTLLCYTAQLSQQASFPKITCTLFINVTEYQKGCKDQCGESVVCVYVEAFVCVWLIIQQKNSWAAMSKKGGLTCSEAMEWERVPME